MLKILCCLLIFYTSQLLAASAPLQVPIEASVLADYQRFVAGRQVQDITRYDGPGARRDVIEMVLLQQALHLGGARLQFQFIPTDASARSPLLLRRGDVLLTFDSVWQQAAQQYGADIFLSSAVINKGEYFAAIATSPQNQKVLHIRQQADFATLSAVSSRVFLLDWQTLSALKLAGLREEDDWHTMARLVSRQWVDFMLVPQSTARQIQLPALGVDLVLVPGIKVLLNDSRHFAVSRQHPLALPTFAALERGLALLRQQNRIQQAYQQCGFFQPARPDDVLISVPSPFPPPATASRR